MIIVSFHCLNGLYSILILFSIPYSPTHIASCSPVIEESDKRAGHNIMRFGRQAGHNIIRFGRAQGHNIMRFGKREESNNAPGSSYEGSMDYDPSYAMNYQASLPSSYGYYGSSPLDYPSSIRSQL